MTDIDPQYRLLTYAAVADLLGKSVATVQRLVRRGEIAAVNVGGKPRIRETEYIAYAKSLEDWQER